MSEIKNIDAETLKKWMDDGDVILIDVREVEEYDVAHIPGAILIPVGTCNPLSVPHNPDKKIVFYCRAGLRGEKACSGCVQAMPERVVYNLTGGINEWIRCGYPVKSV